MLSRNDDGCRRVIRFNDLIGDEVLGIGLLASVYHVPVE